ncbi:MAG: cellulase family glycosylhydrolase [Bacillota bacterium]|nr:cellulase family glycosylhydrolase [Bacillota bacterium]
MKKKPVYFTLCIILTFLTAFTVFSAASDNTSPAKSSSRTQFSDVAEGSWYYGVVSDMTAAGLLKGYPDGTFRPDSKISAAEFVTVAARCAGLEPVSGASGHWAAGQLAAALNSGWYDWDEIPPTGEKHELPITRQLAVKVLMKALLPGEKGDYAQQAPKIRDLSELDGRYYEAVFAAYAAGISEGDDKGCFNPKSGLSRAEACALIIRASKKADLSPVGSDEPSIPQDPSSPVTPDKPIQGGVSENGWLKVEGTSLLNEKDEPVVLRGMSSHGIQWYPQYTSEKAVKNTAEYGANLFRVAMYTAECGYLSSPDSVYNQTVKAVDSVLTNDMYVIIDWHILSDGNPQSHAAEAEKFFDRISKRYSNEPAVLYEICNEPNGNVTWDRDIKPYAERIINTIRSNSPDSVVLVGSGTWSQDIHQAAANPLKVRNIMYSCHFYAGTHGQWLRDRIDIVLKSGIPVFITEWGTSAADGSGGVFVQESEQWIKFMNDRGLSWANWSLCDKNETSAALNPGTSPSSCWTEADLSPSGKLVFSHFKD